MSRRLLDVSPDAERPPEATVSAPVAPRRRAGRRRTWRQAVRRDWQLYSLAVLPLVFFVVFRYLPMAGNIIAFRRYHPGGSIFGDQWVGLRYVRLFLSDSTFWHVFTNTLILGGATLLFTFPLPIVLALLLNEVRTRSLKRKLRLTRVLKLKKSLPVPVLRPMKPPFTSGRPAVPWIVVTPDVMFSGSAE